MRLNLPMCLTWLRILLIPVFVLFFYLPDSVLSTYWRDELAALAFILAAVTDWFDGWLARRWNQVSVFGAFLDPVADKLMVSTALLVLLDLGRVDVVVALIIIGREITISALREWMATLGEHASVAVNWLGKFKTAAQMVAIPLLLSPHLGIFGIDFHWLGSRLIELATALTLWSMFYYLKQAWPIIRERS